MPCYRVLKRNAISYLLTVYCRKTWMFDTPIRPMLINVRIQACIAARVCLHNLFTGHLNVVWSLKQSGRLGVCSSPLTCILGCWAGNAHGCGRLQIDRDLQPPPTVRRAVWTRGAGAGASARSRASWPIWSREMSGRARPWTENDKNVPGARCAVNLIKNSISCSIVDGRAYCLELTYFVVCRSAK